MVDSKKEDFTTAACGTQIPEVDILKEIIREAPVITNPDPVDNIELGIEVEQALVEDGIIPARKDFDS